MMTGDRLPSSVFRFAEVKGEIDNKLVVDILSGRLAGAVFRNWTTLAERTTILDAFWAHPNIQERSVGGTAHYLGAYAYQKHLPEYFELARTGTTDICDILGDRLGPLGRFFETLEVESARIRLASHSLGAASPAVLRSYFASSNACLLEPHDDIAMLQLPAQHGFEIQSVPDFAVCGVNLCLENGSGGNLKIWNILPDAACRTRFGTTYTGDFYPEGELKWIDSIEVEVRAGDLYLFNGGFVHAVLPPGIGAGRRTTLSCFMGHINDKEIVYWA